MLVKCAAQYRSHHGWARPTLPWLCWVMGFAQIRLRFLEGGVGGDGGRTRQQTCIEKHLTAANRFCISSEAHPDFRAWLRH